MKSALPRRLYSAAMYLAAPVMTARLLLKSREHPGYRAVLRERFGWAPRLSSGNQRVHFHCVSVGESLAAIPLIESLARQYPQLAISVSVTTPTGRDRLQSRLPGSIEIVWLPFDLPDAMSRFLDRLQPDLVVLIETELWPNLVHQCYRRQVPVVVVNARMSSRSARGYRRVARLAEIMLAEVSLVMAQFPSDASRFVDLGCPPSRVQVTGSLKFDSVLTEQQKNQRDQISQQWNLAGRKVWIAASTHEGEEELLLSMHERLLQSDSTACLILVPRHPHRCESIRQWIEQRGLNYQLRSQAQGEMRAQVLLVDTIGELGWLYGLASVAFVGGSLVPHGGHNPIEAALWQIPVLTGEHTHNFAEVTQQLAEAGALYQGATVDQLYQWLELWLNQPDAAKQAADAAEPVIQRNRGSLGRQLEAIGKLLGL